MAFGLDISTILGLIVVLIVALGAGLAFCIWKVGKAPPAPAGTYQEELQRVAAGDIHRLDDAYKKSPLYAAMQHLEQIVTAAAQKARADAQQVGNAVQGAVSNAVSNFHVPAAVKVDGGPTGDPEIARLQQQMNERAAAIKRQLAASTVVDVPPANAGEGVETYAARVGVDATAMRLLSALHPGDTWETLADRLKNPSRYFTDADRDTVAAASSSPAAVNR